MTDVDVALVADLWEENQESLKQALGRSDSTRFGARWVLMPHVDSPRFNHVSRIRIAPAEVDELVGECQAFFRREGLSGCCLMTTPATTPADLGARLYRLGFMSETNPVMLWQGDRLSVPNPRIRVERTTRADADTVFHLLSQVFFRGARADVLAMGRRGVDISYDLGAVNYLAFVGDRPVGTGTLYRTGPMGGVYNMCTLPEMRGQGVATAIMAASLADAEQMGCTYVGLTPTEMGRPLYERLGFREIYRETYFVERFDW